MGSGVNAQLRRVPARSLTGDAPIVVLAPHPDDESLGCGALLAHAFENHGAHVVCMTDGGRSHPASSDWPPDRLSALRWHELSHAIVRLGGQPTDMTWLGYPDGWLGRADMQAVAASIAQICTAQGARHMFAPAAEDHHEDHRTTARIARQVSHLLPDLTVFSYPVWSRWDNPDLLDDVAHLNPVALDPGRWQACKSLAIKAHRSQRGLVVEDDPDGFCMPKGFVGAFASQPEIFWKAV